MNTINIAYDFLRTKGFLLIEEDTSKFFSDYYDVFSDEVFQLRFSNSKFSETLDIRFAQPDEKWYDLALVKAFLHNEQELDHPTSIKDYTDFLIGEFDKIGILFKKENYLITKNTLENLGKKRAKQLFPGV